MSINNPQRLPLEVWENIFRNTQEDDEEIEIQYLDSGTAEYGEWCLCVDCEMFEDGFKTEKEAQERLDYLENTLL